LTKTVKNIRLLFRSVDATSPIAELPLELAFSQKVSLSVMLNLFQHLSRDPETSSG